MMPIDHELFRPFSNFWEVGDQSYEWTAHGSDLLLRPHGAPLSTVWVMLNQGHSGPLLAMPRSRNEPLFPVSVKTRHALQSRLLWRLWPLSKAETCLVRARSSLLRADGLETTRFGHQTFADFDVASAREMADWCQTLEAPDADLQQARRWQRLSPSEKICQIIDVRGGSWDELMRLLEAAFVLWAQPATSHLPASRGDSFELDLSASEPSFRSLSWSMKGRPIDDALKIAGQHWSLRRRALNDFTHWWRGCDEFGDPLDVPQPKFVYSDSSQHQRLEALLLWRAWLRDKLPPDQIDALLASAL